MDFAFYSGTPAIANRAFLHGDAVKVSFYVRNSEVVMAEECYFYLMASMRKMRMRIPLEYTLDYFQSLLAENVLAKGISDAVVTLMMYRNQDGEALEKAAVSYYGTLTEAQDITAVRGSLELDVIREIHVNTHLLSNIRVHCPENIYAEIYAKENGLDDLILLNPSKRIARSIYGNLLFLEGDEIKIPKHSEGAYISPLLENFVTFLHKQNLAVILEVEMAAFESQKAQEVLMISDEKGIFAVEKIRNKTFAKDRFAGFVSLWQAGLNSLSN